MTKTSKKEMVNQIAEVLIWYKENSKGTVNWNGYGKKISVALGKAVWYDSIELMKKKIDV